MTPRQIVVGLHGAFFLLTEDGAIYQQVRDAERFIWQKIEGPPAVDEKP
jgi:hypothetical protein